MADKRDQVVKEGAGTRCVHRSVIRGNLVRGAFCGSRGVHKAAVLDLGQVRCQICCERVVNPILFME